MRTDRRMAELQVEADQLRSALHGSQSQHASLLDKTRGLGLGGKTASQPPATDLSFAASTSTIPLAQSGTLGKTQGACCMAGAVVLGGYRGSLPHFNKVSP